MSSPKKERSFSNLKEIILMIVGIFGIYWTQVSNMDEGISLTLLIISIIVIITSIFMIVSSIIIAKKKK